MTDFKEQSIRLFSRALLHCAEVLVLVRDPYLHRSLQDAIEHALRSVVLSSGDIHECVDAIGELHRCLEELSMSQTDSLRALLLAERHILLLLLHAKQEPRETVRKAASKKASPGTTKESLGSANGMFNGHLSVSAQQVLEGVQATEPVRAKDIIEHCNPMSERTVRRSLSELVSVGLVVKDANNGAVLYRLANRAGA